MLDSKNKLYAVMLGGMAPGCHIELHDVQFTITDNIVNAYTELLDKWFGTAEKMHIDSYMVLDVVDGYEISLRHEKPSHSENLYFINMGAYEDGKFAELHEIKFLVDSSKINVKKRAKESMLKGKISVHTDDLFEVDDLMAISEVNGFYVHLSPTSKAENLSPTNGYHPISKRFVKDYLERKDQN